MKTTFKRFWPAFCCLLFASLTNTQAATPNILFIYVDDLGWKDAGFMGSDFYETPELDKMAAESLVFTDAYSAAANCAPARASLMSGQYTPRHKIFNVGRKPRGDAAHRRLMHVTGTDKLDPDIRTWPQQLQAAGYRTGTFGKWHLSHDPLPYGFDVNIGGSQSGGPPRGYYPPHGKAPGLQDAPDDEYVTDRLSDEAIKFIRESKDQPWLVYLTHFAVHTPIEAKKTLVPKYQEKAPGDLHDDVRMATMIEAVDQGLGKIRATLDELGVADNTVTIFYSDNGGFGPVTDMDPLKGYKGCFYEGGIRVPFFVHWPGKIKPGKSAEPITGVDLYPTLCDLAGAELPQNQPLDGVDLVPLFTGEVTALPDRAIFWHFPAYLESYTGTTDEQRDSLFRTRPCSIIRHGDWKLHQYFEDGAIELYNLRDDIGETTNLAESNPTEAARLLGELQAWQTAIDAPIPTTPNPEFDADAEAEAAAKKREPKQQRPKKRAKTNDAPSS